MEKKKILICFLVLFSIIILPSCKSEQNFANENNINMDYNNNDETVNKYNGPKVYKIDDKLPESVDNFDKNYWYKTEDYYIQNIKYLDCEFSYHYEDNDICKYDTTVLYNIKINNELSEEEFSEIIANNKIKNTNLVNKNNLFTKLYLNQKAIDCFNDKDNANIYIYFDGLNLVQYKYTMFYNMAVKPNIALEDDDYTIYFKHYNEYDDESNESKYLKLYLPYQYMSEDNLKIYNDELNKNSNSIIDKYDYIKVYYLEVTLKNID